MILPSEVSVTYRKVEFLPRIDLLLMIFRARLVASGAAHARNLA
jgi:hypothetical protein